MKKIVLYIILGAVGLTVVVGSGLLSAWLVGRNYQQAAQVVQAGGVPVANGPRVKATPENTLALKPFTTNLADESRTSYIQVTFELVLSDAKKKRAVEGQTSAIRDVIVRILNARKSLEVTSDEGANKLKADILTAINQVLDSQSVADVLITDKVVQ